MLQGQKEPATFRDLDEAELVKKLADYNPMPSA
jgi:hypothetical protein